jgi:methyl-accepting chemotaxis protein
MKNWTITKYINLGFAAVLTLVIVLAVISAMSLRSIQRNLAKVTEDSLPGVTAIAEIKGLVAENELDVVRHMLAANSGDKKAFEDRIAARNREIQNGMADYEKTIHLDDDRSNFRKLQEAQDHFAPIRERALELSRSAQAQEVADYRNGTLRPAYDAYIASCDLIFKWNADYGVVGATQIVNTVNRANLLVVIVSVAAVILGCALAFLIVRRISGGLSRVAGSLNDGSNQVASAAAQVSGASQTLAEGASEQAASLEETSSSLEEMSSMTRRNAENAQKANDLAKQARSAADKGAGDMQAMSAAMEAIKVSSDDIAKIIKTIDEIAFQTNILALNAAVEAARAGEAGMGFAVVADEVRNLAQRSAQAAKETAAKIEGAITKTGQGVEISTKVGLALSEIVEKARQVDELVAEVAGASREQTQGISQINTAVGQMDKVTQSNAATAEESAAASEELNAQAEVMKQSVGELLKLVGGAAGSPAASSARTIAVRPQKPARSVRTNGNGHHRNGKGATTALSAPATTAVARSEIPLEGDFKDF